MRFIAGTFFLILLLFSYPENSFAQQLVPVKCSDPQQCGTCELVDLTNNLIQFILVISSLIAVLAFVYAGFMLVTSQGNVSAAQKARTIFTDVAIGYVLILTAFLVIDTILGTLLPSGSSILNWRSVECVYPTEVVDRGNAGRDRSATLGSGGTPLDDDFLSGAGVCSADLLQPIFGERAAAAACIANAESGCGASFYSRTDRDTNGESFSVSPWQINLTVHEIQGCGPTLDCKSAYSGRNYDAVIVNRGLYDACVSALKDVTCAARNADRIRRQSGWDAWTTASGCGL